MIDLYNELQSNPQLVNRLGDLSGRLKQLEDEMGDAAQYHEDVPEICYEILRTCEYNAGFLLPYFFPTAIFNGPLSLLNRPFAFTLMDLNIGGETAIRGSRQISKCRAQSGSEPVYAENGRPLYPDELKPGTRLATLNDRTLKLRSGRISEVHQNPSMPVFRVRTRLGGEFVLTANHPLRTLFGYTELSTLKPGSRIAAPHRLSTFKDKPVDHSRVILTAYMLGDGCCGIHKTFGLTAAHPEVIWEFQALASLLQLTPLRVYAKDRGSKACEIRCSHKSKLATWLKEDALWGKASADKRVPSWVFDLSREQTILFLSRLWATDGMIKHSKTGTQISFTSVSYRLARDVRALLTKLGIIASISRVKTGYRKLDGERVTGQDAYVVRVETRRGWKQFLSEIKVPGKPPFQVPDTVSNNNRDTLPIELNPLLRQLSAEFTAQSPVSFKSTGFKIGTYPITRRKLQDFALLVRPCTRDNPAWKFIDQLLEGDLIWDEILEIKPAGEEPTWDVEVAGDHNYILDGVVSHNSTTLIARQQVNAHLISGFRSLYIAPHTEHLKTYQNKFREMERAFRYGKVYTDLRQNLGYKEYPNGSVTELIRVDSSASDARGKTTDDLIYDEFQNFDVNFLPEVEQTQKASKLPCRLYTGTSLTIDTALEAKYQSGSQATWRIPLGIKGKYLDCGDAEEVLKIIKPQGPTCPLTGKILRLEQGFWHHHYPARAEAGFISYHIPQIIIPDYVDEPLKWLEIYKAYQDYSSLGQIKKFIQEVLGIPTEDGVRELSETDLKRMCLLPETKETLLKRARSGYYKYVVAGIDWGGSDWNPVDKTKLSYTFHTIAGVTTDGKIDILYMYRYAGMDYQTILKRISDDNILYGVGFTASDFAAGSLYNLLLRQMPGIRAENHFILQYGGPDTRLFSRPESSELFNHFHLNRTDSITQLFTAIKAEVPRLRCFAWDEARGYLMDFLNMFRVLHDTESGVTKFRYRRHGSKADDGLHATNYAYVMARLLMNEPLIEDKALKLELQSRLRTHAGPRMHGRSGIISG